jgi:DNA-binding transcriptional MerR regulator
VLTKDFLARINAQIKKEGLRPVDPRARATVNEKTLKFYVLKGLVPAPERRGTRLDFDETHVEAVLKVKRQQAAGFTLQEIADREQDLRREGRQKLTDVAWPPFTFERRGLDMTNRTAFNATATPRRISGAMGPLRREPRVSATIRWHLDLGDGYEISGQGSIPNESVLNQLRAVLANEHLSTTDDDT